MADETFTYIFNQSLTSGGTQQDDIVVSVTTPVTNSTGFGNGYAITAIGGTLGSSFISGEVGSGGTSTRDAEGYSFDNTIFTSNISGVGGNSNGIDGYGLEFAANGHQYNIYNIHGNSSWSKTLSMVQSVVN